MAKTMKVIETEITKRIRRVITRYSCKENALKAVESIFKEGELAATLDSVSVIFKPLVEKLQEIAARCKEQRNKAIQERKRVAAKKLEELKTGAEIQAELLKKIAAMEKDIKEKAEASEFKEKEAALKEQQLRAEMERQIEELRNEKDRKNQELVAERSKTEDIERQLKRANEKISDFEKQEEMKS
jgi:chromosome segregation ATPase